MAVAAIEQHFRRQDSARRLGTMLESIQEPIPVPSATARRRTIRCAEGTRSLAERRLRFRALLVKRAYGLAEYLPAEAVLNLRHVLVHPDGTSVMLTLWSGTQLLDTGDRVTVRGDIDDVTIEELVSCCARRGWAAVEVEGSPEFRMAASRELLRRGIRVVDCPLDDEEQEQLRADADTTGFDWSVVEDRSAYVPKPPWID